MATIILTGGSGSQPGAVSQEQRPGSHGTHSAHWDLSAPCNPPGDLLLSHSPPTYPQGTLLRDQVPGWGVSPSWDKQVQEISLLKQQRSPAHPHPQCPSVSPAPVKCP
jgi:hypothetical protein